MYDLTTTTIIIIVPSRWLFNPDIIRNVICARDQCFNNVILAEMAKTLKVLPMERGGSINQKAMEIAITKLNTGHWLSLFPEGYIAQDGEIHRIRRGVGKLILESHPTPRVYPVYHRGMEGVKSEEKWLPSFGSHIVVKLGKQIPVQDIIDQFNEGKHTADEAYVLIAARIEDKMKELKLEVDEYRKQHSIKNKCEVN
jgi:monolysocardiolipin acyltransferase